MPEKSKSARDQAEARFKRAEIFKTEGQKAWAEHLAQGEAVQARTARLKAERLAREATDQASKPSTPKPEASRGRKKAAPRS